VGGAPCKFRTCYDTTFWPVSVASAEWTTADRLRPPIKAADTSGAIRLELKCAGDVTFQKLSMSALRLHLSGEGALVNSLYELLCNNCSRIVIRDPSPKAKAKPVILEGSALRAVGFAEEESMLPYSRRSFAGYRLIMEYFCFPQKFFFFDLTGLDRLRTDGFGERAEIIFLISPFERSERREVLESGITAKTFRTDCVPVINLFRHTAEPIQLNHMRYEYQVVPDVSRRNATEIFSIDDVVSSDPRTDEVFQFEPFYSFRHGASRERDQAFWHSVRKPSGRRGDEGTEIFLSLVDLSGRAIRPDAETLTVRTTCTNRDLPLFMPTGQAQGELQGRPRKGGDDGGKPDADEEHAHHALAAPFVGEPARRIRKHPEREEARRRVFEKLAVAEPPFARERERRDRREDQREQVIEEMPDVEKQEMRAIAIHGYPGQSLD
jgi:type VI secretion system protein ImpG